MYEWTYNTLGIKMLANIKRFLNEVCTWWIKCRPCERIKTSVAMLEIPTKYHQAAYDSGLSVSIDSM